MASFARLTVLTLAVLLTSTGIVAAESQHTDAQPGFGVLIAVTALLIAFLIARRKRRQAEAEADEPQRETAQSVS